MTISVQDKREVENLFQWLLDNDIEIVSYGLAPNPFGFCFECHNDNTRDAIKRHAHERLESLNSVQTEYLRFITF